MGIIISSDGFMLNAKRQNYLLVDVNSTQNSVEILTSMLKLHVVNIYHRDICNYSTIYSTNTF